MCDEDREVNWLEEPFRLDEGSEYVIICSPDNPRHMFGQMHSSGFPMKVMELHSKDNCSAVATVFSYNLGYRFQIAFRIEDVRDIA